MRRLKRTSLLATTLVPVVAVGDPLTIGGEIFIPVNRAGVVEHNNTLIFTDMGIVVPADKWAEVGSELLISSSFLEESGATANPKLVIVPDLPEVQVGWSFGGFMLGSTTLATLGVLGWDYIAWNYLADIAPSEEKMFAEVDWYNADPGVPFATVSFEVSAPSILGGYSPFVPTPEYTLLGSEAGIFKVSSQGYLMIDQDGSDVARDYSLQDRIGDTRTFDIQADLNGKTAITNIEVQIFDAGSESVSNSSKNAFLFYAQTLDESEVIIGSDQPDVWTTSATQIDQQSFGYDALGTLNGLKVFPPSSFIRNASVFLGDGDDQAYLRNLEYDNEIFGGDGDDKFHFWESDYSGGTTRLWTGNGRDSIYLYNFSGVDSLNVLDFSSIDRLYIEDDLQYSIISYGYDSSLEIQGTEIFFVGYEITDTVISRFSYDTDLI